MDNNNKKLVHRSRKKRGASAEGRNTDWKTKLESLKMRPSP